MKIQRILGPVVAVLVSGCAATPKMDQPRQTPPSPASSREVEVPSKSKILTSENALRYFIKNQYKFQVKRIDSSIFIYGKVPGDGQSISITTNCDDRSGAVYITSRVNGKVIADDKFKYNSDLGRKFRYEACGY